MAETLSGLVILLVVVGVLGLAIWGDPAGFAIGIGRQLVDGLLPGAVKAVRPKAWTDEQLAKIRRGEDPNRKRQRER